MAKGVLRLFGALTIAGGLALLAVVFEGRSSPEPATLLAVVPIASALILAGSALVGFAQVIALLERIERNTRPGGSGA